MAFLMTRTSAVFALSIALAACGGKGDGATTTPTTTVPTAAAPFELGEITVFEGAQAMLKIHADGSTELGGHSGRMELKPGQPASSDSLPVVFKPGPTLKTDGTIEWKGKAVARVNADGTVTNLETNQAAPVTVTADKVTFDEGTIVLSADGKMTFAGPNAKQPTDDKQPRVEGADSPGKRRTVLALVGMMFGGEHQVKAEGESTSAPATLAPAPTH
jgi:hypothetical protein